MTDELLQQIRMIAPILGLVLIWSLESVQAGWWLSGRIRHAGDRAEIDSRIGRLLTLAV